ncbi:ABC transporter ATP-binding protein [Enterococcus hulanensis]|uniref:ABC transporter ATP-binding protein n=1 Tax=Enterococcus hulanensis TaxID=2559929 RepID=A0ABU3EU96_9ENTE|nr:ABC transporter ATP-binding protein [Enterococcus hulanensis]MDT2598418.1 ABC transporter ATP-binding protein [Enterococcus hulanensis]MDT2608077.1 ABC transporter ATP-binding protein [Enterococcus hulanensis]MDT2615372.1 ABC transporter ATP-binding protein [Enterococcus hulanensis]MDT2626657.1 ABC transporter ATP-binding protein [Enterococcus hulanensis]
MIKTLMGSIREYKRDSFLSPFFVMLEVVMEVLIPLLMAKIIDEGVVKQNMNYIMRMGVILIVLTLCALAFGIISSRFSASASAGFAKNIRKDMFSNIQKFSFSNIDKFSAASLVTRVSTDVVNVQIAYESIIRVAIRCPLLLIFSLVMAMSVNFQLSLIFMAAIPILGIGLFLIISRSQPIFQRVYKVYDRLNNVVRENIRGIRVVKSFVRSEEENRKFQEVSQEIYNDYTKAEKIMAINGPLMQFTVYTCTLLISWFSANLIVSNVMTTGELTSMITYLMQILTSLMILAQIFTMLTIAQASGDRIVEVLGEKSNLNSGTLSIETVPDGSIEFENVSFSYQEDSDKLSLRNINLMIHNGETIGIIGGTGSSKSTLVQLIPRLYDVTSGVLRVGGIDVREYDLSLLRNNVAMVLQKNELFSGTIKENLRWGDENASDSELERVCKLAQAHDFISALPDGYETVIEQGGSNVSGGQKQRLCIARALLKKPKILILDDSTSAVDTKTDAMLRQAFKEEIPDTTKLIIAQRISSVQDADRIIVLDAGGINSFGTHEELLGKSQIYREIVQSQTKGAKVDETE